MNQNQSNQPARNACIRCANLRKITVRDPEVSPQEVYTHFYCMERKQPIYEPASKTCLLMEKMMDV